MDQMTSACGVANQLLCLRCQPATIEGQLRLPADLALWGIDSGVRHAVSGADYGSVRCASFMGLAMLKKMGHLLDCLSQLSPSLWQQVAKLIPQQMTGKEFLQDGHLLGDNISQLESDRQYQVQVCTAPDPRKPAH